MNIKNSTGFRVTGMKSNAVSIADQNQMIPFLWDVFTKTTWTVLSEDNGVKQLAAVRHNYTDESFDYLIGIITGQKHGLPEMVTPSGMYIELEETGPMPETRERLDREVNQYIKEQSNIHFVDTIIELYEQTKEENIFKLKLMIEVRNDEKE